MKPGDPAAVEQLFDAVAPRYDRLNDVLSFGLHRQWKRQLVRAIKPGAGEHWLDLCCGTGDLALELGRCVRPAGAVTGLDAAAAPLERARQRQRQQPWLPVTFQQGDALNTGLTDACADGAVMAYGLRNLADPLQGLQELRRLLKPGGRAGACCRLCGLTGGVRLPGEESGALSCRPGTGAAGPSGGICRSQPPLARGWTDGRFDPQSVSLCLCRLRHTPSLS